MVPSIIVRIVFGNYFPEYDKNSLLVLMYITQQQWQFIIISETLSDRDEMIVPIPLFIFLSIYLLIFFPSAKLNWPLANEKNCQRLHVILIFKTSVSGTKLHSTVTCCE